MTGPMLIPWRCECGKTVTAGLPSGYCPICKSRFETIGGSRRVLSGAWDVLPPIPLP